MPNFVTQPSSVIWRKQNGSCFYCSLSLVPPARGNDNGHHPHLATVDHIHPRSKGGKRYRGNVILACQRCNVLRGNMAFSEFTAVLPVLRQVGLLVELTSMEGVVPIIHWKSSRNRRLQITCGMVHQPQV